MVSCGINTPYKLSGTTSSIPSSQKFWERSESLHCPSQVRQYFGSDLRTSIKKGCSLQITVRFDNRNLGVASDLQDHLGSRTSSWNSQHHCKSAIKNNLRSLRVIYKWLRAQSPCMPLGTTWGRWHWNINMSTPSLYLCVI